MEYLINKYNPENFDLSLSDYDSELEIAYLKFKANFFDLATGVGKFDLITEIIKLEGILIEFHEKIKPLSESKYFGRYQSFVKKCINHAKTYVKWD